MMASCSDSSSTVAVAAAAAPPPRSKACDSVIICFSGIKMKNRSDSLNPFTYKSMVESLGCEYADVLDIKTVNYLVVGKVGNSKHIAAIKYNIPCVTETWLVDSYNSGTLLPVTSSGDGCCSHISYIPSLLHGLNILMTNITSADKKSFQAALAMHGATYTETIVDDTLAQLTHCITDRARLNSSSNNNGGSLSAKLECVVDHNASQPSNRPDKQVKLVDKQWLIDILALSLNAVSSSSGQESSQLQQSLWLSEDAYVIHLPNQAAATASTATATAAAAVDDSSRISNSSHTSSIHDSMNASAKAATTCVTSDHGADVSATRQQSNEKDKQNRALYYNDIKFDDLPSLTPLPPPPANKFAFVSSSSSSQLPFTSMVFYICGFQDLRIVDYLARCIALGGGRRSIVFSIAVTTVIIGPYADIKNIQMIRQHPIATPMIVHIYYAIEALQHCGLIPPSSMTREFVDIIRLEKGKGDSSDIIMNSSRRHVSVNNMGIGLAHRSAPAPAAPATAPAATVPTVPKSNIVNKRYLRNISNLMLPSVNVPGATVGPNSKSVAAGKTLSLSLPAPSVATKRKFGL